MTDSGRVAQTLLERVNTIAVVGLSSNPARPSHQIAQYLLQAGFRIVPVNPNEASVLGIPSAPALESVADPIDLVNVFRRPEFVPEVAESAVRVGAGGLWLQPGAGSPQAETIALNAGMPYVSGLCIMVEHRRWVAVESRRD